MVIALGLIGALGLSPSSAHGLRAGIENDVPSDLSAGLEQTDSDWRRDPKAVTLRLLVALQTEGEDHAGSVRLSYRQVTRLLNGDLRWELLSRNPHLVTQINRVLQWAFGNEPPSSKSSGDKTHRDAAQILQGQGITEVQLNKKTSFRALRHDPAEVGNRLLKALLEGTNIESGIVVLSHKRAARLLKGSPSRKAFELNPSLTNDINKLLREAFGKKAPLPQQGRQAIESWRI